MHFKIGFIHFDCRTLSLGTILSDRFNHILIGEKIELFTKNSEKGWFCFGHISWKQIPWLKIWGLEQTSRMGQQNGWEKRQKEHFFKGGILTNKITLFFGSFFYLSGPFLGRKQAFGTDLGLALTRGIQLEHIFRSFIVIFGHFLWFFPSFFFNCSRHFYHNC